MELDRYLLINILFHMHKYLLVKCSDKKKYRHFSSFLGLFFHGLVRGGFPDFVQREPNLRLHQDSEQRARSDSEHIGAHYRTKNSILCLFINHLH